MQGEARHIFGYVTYRVSEMMEGAGRFVDGVKAAGVEFFAGVPVKFSCGCPLSIPDVARPPRPCRKGEGALATALYQRAVSKLLRLQSERHETSRDR